MLNVSSLENEIKKAFDETLPGAFEQAILATFPGESESGKEMAEAFGNIINDLISGPLAQRLAAAIDCHVKNASISGMIITTGSPFTQQAMINSPSPITNGIVPNSFKIS